MATRGAPRRLISRDLTTQFHQQRKHTLLQRQQSSSTPRQRFTRGAGSEALIGPAGEHNPSVDKGACLPPQWVDFADKAREEIRDIQSQLVQLTKAQQRRLLKAESGLCVEDREVEVLSGSIAMLIRCCEQSIYQVKTFSDEYSAALMDEEFRKNVQRSLAAELQQLSKKCREAQKQYLAEVKSRQSAAAGDLESGAAGHGGATGSSIGAGDTLASTQSLDEIERMEQIAAHRSAHISQIATSVNDLNMIFKDLAALVIDQGSILDRIDYNTEKVYNRSDQARGQVQKAVAKKKQSDGRVMKCFFFWVALDLAALLVLVIKYVLKYGRNAFWVMLFVFLTVGGLIFWCRRRIAQIDVSKAIPESWNPQNLWKKLRPGPINAAKAAAAANRANRMAR